MKALYNSFSLEVHVFIIKLSAYYKSRDSSYCRSGNFRVTKVSCKKFTC